MEENITLPRFYKRQKRTSAYNSNTDMKSENRSSYAILEVSQSSSSSSPTSISKSPPFKPPPSSSSSFTSPSSSLALCSSFVLGRSVKSEKSISRPPIRASRYYTPVVTLLTFVFVILVNSFNFGNCASAFVASGNSDSLKASRIIIPQTIPKATTTVDAHGSEKHKLLTFGVENDINFYDKNIHSPSVDFAHHIALRDVTTDGLQVTGVRVEKSGHEIHYQDDGVPELKSNTEATLRIFGTGIGPDTVISFTSKENVYGGACMFPATSLYKPLPDTAKGNSAVYKVTLPKEKNVFYICAKNDELTDEETLGGVKPLVHQGKEPSNRISTYEDLLPLWASIVIILTCLCFSALFSGLNLGLMALDRTELKILLNTGTDKEREYARKIQPVRDQGNYLLCSILLGNVLVNSTFTILLDGLTSGLFAVIFSTLAIVVFGEITPQAVCSRHGLAIGAKTIFITRCVMLFTFPLSYPTSKILDLLLGEEIGNVYNRERLKELLRVTTGINDLDKNEVNIISGALELRKKTVADVMTHIDDAFMLPLDAILDFETVSEIMKSGFSRIPVYDGDKKNIVTLLYIKDLAFVDTDDNTPLKTLCEFYQNPVHFVFEDATLDIMFNQFKDGTIGHIAFVHRVNNEGDGDPFYETIGLVTLEDVIEELIQAEIVDETDVFIDNRTKVRRNRYKKQDFTVFAESRRENQSIRISPQLALATFQYLSASVDAFKKENISESILRRLLNQDIIFSIKCKGKEKDDPGLFIYQQGKPVDFFVLILEGRVEVTVGKESLLFESGPFTYFGTQALVQNVVTLDSPIQPSGSLQSLNLDSKVRQTFVPDYSVRAATDVIYIAIKRGLYLTAKKATLLEKTRRSGLAESSSEAIDAEVEKLLHSLHDDDKHHIRGSQSIRKVSATNGGSNTVSPTLNMSSPNSRSNLTSIHGLQQHSPGSNSNDLIDAVSLSSQVTSDPANELANSIDRHDQANKKEKEEINTTTPLLQKPETKS